MKKAPWLLLLAPLYSLAQQPSADAAGFSKSLQPFFAKNCVVCHNAKLKNGGLDLEAASATSVVQERDRFERILRRIELGEMPPKARPRPNDEELKLATNWLETEFERQDRIARPGRVLARRLNRTEYNNTVRDLLGVDDQPADEFPPDDSAFGFDNVAQALSVSPSLMEKLLATAERVARAAVFGPQLKPMTVIFQPTVPRRMEFTNRLKVEPPAYYTKHEYDTTGLSQPGSFHLTYKFPVDGEYLIQIVGAGFRPNGSDPGQMSVWFDGKLIKTFAVDVDVEEVGFERRPDHWDLRLNVTAGPHEIVAAFPNQFHGLPTIFEGPSPSKVAYDPCKKLGNGAGRCLALQQNLPPETDPVLAERRRLNLERLKQDEAHPVFEGMSITEVSIVWPPDLRKPPSAESRRKIFICEPVNGRYQPDCRRRMLANLASRAYRRPATQEEVDGLVAIASSAERRGGSFEEGLATGIAAILASPNFLFRIDRERAPAETVGQYDLASRLSYFLWSTMPDEELLRTAAQGTLRRPEVLGAQVRRMLADSRAEALIKNFASQWLETRRMESVQPDRERYPDFDDYLRSSIIKETELFFQHIMQKDRSVLDLIDGPYTFLNERLARHYGIRGVTGTDFRMVDLTGTGRSGILTQASVLTVSSYANRTSAVLRGKWVLENILNSPPPPPPPNVPSLNEEAVGASATLRQQMEAHRKNPVCASCHTRMDPLGFGLENYDAVGAWRTMDGKFPIDPSGVLPDGRSFDGATGLKAILKAQKDAFAEGMIEKMLIYALGRGIESGDRSQIRRIVARMGAEDYKFSSLMLGIINSPAFQMEKKETEKREMDKKETAR